MECSNIQEKLSAYTENIISYEEKLLIEEHLKFCRKCSKSLSELRKTVKYVQSLEEIEPPQWLTQKIMARIRSEVGATRFRAEPKKGVFQKLFYPLHIKLPIEAFATIAIVITAVYIFKTIQPEMKVVQAPTGSENVIAKDEVRKQSQQLRAVATIPKDEIASPLARNDRKGASSEEKVYAFKESKPISVKPAEPEMPAKKPENIEKYTEAPKAPAPVVRQEKVMPSAGAVAKDESKREAISAAPKPKKLVEGKGSAASRDSISLTLKVKDLETVSEEIEKVFIQLGGKKIKTESFDNKKVIIIELSSKKLKELFEKLKLIGEVKEERVVLEEQEGDVRIEIEIVGISDKN